MIINGMFNTLLLNVIKMFGILLLVKGIILASYYLIQSCIDSEAYESYFVVRMSFLPQCILFDLR